MFRRAAIRLTMFFSVVQLLLFAALETGIYWFVTTTFDFDTAQREGAGAANVAEQGFATLRAGLLTGFGLLALVVPVTSYLMARASLTPIRRSYELQEQFVDGASHEFRGPLSVVQGELELALSRERTPREYQGAIRRSLRSVDELTDLTSALLLLSRVSPRERREAFETIQVRELVGMLGRKAHTVTLIEGPPALISGSVPLLRAAIENLLDNARKFTPPGGTVTLSSAVAAGIVAIQVSDTGVGMSPDEVKMAFDPFWRAMGAHTLPGSGLGLAFVDRVARAHGGIATIASKAGAGTTVKITLPAIVS